MLLLLPLPAGYPRSEDRTSIKKSVCTFIFTPTISNCFGDQSTKSAVWQQRLQLYLWCQKNQCCRRMTERHPRTFQEVFPDLVLSLTSCHSPQESGHPKCLVKRWNITSACFVQGTVITLLIKEVLDRQISRDLGCTAQHLIRTLKSTRAARGQEDLNGWDTLRSTRRWILFPQVIKETKFENF